MGSFILKLSISGLNSHHFALAAFLGVLFKKLVMHKLSDVLTVAGVFLQTAHHEILSLSRNVRIRGECHCIFDDFYELILLRDLKRVLASKHFIHHDAQRPNIYFFVVVIAL